MATCAKCNRSNPDGSQACSHCGAPIRSKWWNAMPWSGISYTYMILLAIWYLIIWPILSFEMFYALMAAMLGCLPGYCNQFRTPLDDLSNSGLMTITAVILMLFPVSLLAKLAGHKVLQVLAETHRYACLLTPSAVGIGTLGLPSPFLVSLPYALVYPSELPILLGLFGVTWILLFIVIAADALMPPKAEKSNQDLKNSAASTPKRKK